MTGQPKELLIYVWIERSELQVLLWRGKRVGAFFPFYSPPLAVSPRFFLFIPLRSLVLGYLNSKKYCMGDWPGMVWKLGYCLMTVTLIYNPSTKPQTPIKNQNEDFKYMNFLLDTRLQMACFHVTAIFLSVALIFDRGAWGDAKILDSWPFFRRERLSHRYEV